MVFVACCCTDHWTPGSLLVGHLFNNTPTKSGTLKFIHQQTIPVKSAAWSSQLLLYTS